jgi:Rrf2 family protein
MLGLSKKTDYALLALSHLAHAPAGEAIRARVIAEQYSIPVELLAKILQRLAKAKIVAATPGPTGGYILSKSPNQISVAEILATIDGTPAIIHCLSPSHPACDQHTKCTIREPLTRLNTRLMQLLNSTTLAELCEPEGHPRPATIQITQRNTTYAIAGAAASAAHTPLTADV